MEDIVVDQPEIERYERIKSELIKRLADSDGTKMRKMLESEEIWYRMPSQFYRDLKKLAIPTVPDQLVLALWKNHLQADAYLILVAATESNPKALTGLMDWIYETRPGTSRKTAASEPRERIQNARASEP